MISKTTITAIRTLLYLSGRSQEGAISPRRVATALGESPSYLSKITRELVKVGILRAEKGVKGGVHLARPPSEISLLAVVEACQGPLLRNYCQSASEPASWCSWHHAAAELHFAVEGVLSRWNLERLLEKPFAPGGRCASEPCVMAGKAVQWVEGP